MPGKDTDIPLAVAAPKGVTVRRTARHRQQHPPGSDVVVGTVEFAVDTAAAGEFAVTFSKGAFKVPVTATVKPGQKGQTRVLVVETPFRRGSTDRGVVFKAWTDLVADAELDASYLLVSRGKPVLRDLDLAQFDCVLLAGAGLVELQGADLKQARKYAEGGGRVVVSASHFYRGTVEKANAVLDGYGLRVRDEEAREARKKVTVGPAALDPAVAGVRSAAFFRASPVAVTNAGAGRGKWWHSARGCGGAGCRTSGRGWTTPCCSGSWWRRGRGSDRRAGPGLGSVPSGGGPRGRGGGERGPPPTTTTSGGRRGVRVRRLRFAERHGPSSRFIRRRPQRPPRHRHSTSSLATFVAGRTASSSTTPGRSGQ